MPQAFEPAQASSPSANPGALWPTERDTVMGAEPRPVRHDVALEGEEILVLRYFKIKKGSFPTFLKASREGVWPYAEKCGARVVGLWQVIHPSQVAVSAERAAIDYDEVYLLTRYASVEHWAATRDFTRLGGNGPDAEKAYAAHLTREAVTLQTSFVFLQGHLSANPPYFMPPVDERYQLMATPQTSP